jgi:hypothetical protein
MTKNETIPSTSINLHLWIMTHKNLNLEHEREYLSSPREKNNLGRRGELETNF